MKKVENLIISGSKDKPINMDIFYGDGNSVNPIVIFCHGFKGFKNWGHFDLLAEEFSKHNLIFVKFNFSFNGTSIDQPCDFNDLNAFGENNYSIETNDLGLVIDFIEKHAALYSGDPNKIYLLGHSRGGGIAILKTSEDERIKKLATWASVKDTEDFFGTTDLEQWQKEGVLYTYNSRTKQNMPLYYQLYENYIAHKKQFHIPSASVKINIPWLIIHGTNDSSVPYLAAEKLHEWNPKSELFLIEHADHTFGGKHPWIENDLPVDAKLAVMKTIEFLSA